MYNKVFAILIIIFSIIIIASNDTFAESKNDMMNMKEDKKNTMDMKNMKHHDERKKLNSSQGKNEIIFPEVAESKKDNNGYKNYTLKAQEGKTEFYKNNFSNTLG
ncbi:copper oxidase, partial [Staphylococcus epidermidis]